MRIRWMLVVLALVAPACGSGGDSALEINIRRIGLDLAFQADKDAPIDKLPPVPAPIPDLQIVSGRLEVVAPTAPVLALCPEAPKDARPAESATATVEKPPAAGTYLLHNKGTLGISGVINLTVPYPLMTRQTVSDIKDETTPPDALGTSGARTIEYTVRKEIGLVSITDVLTITSTQIALKSRTVKTQEGEVAFNPQPPVKLMTLNGDLTWESAGADLATGASMAVKGEIVGRAAVDICGEVYDTYRIKSSETTASLLGDTPFTITTDDLASPNDPKALPNFYNIATQHGALFLIEENHTTTQVGSTIISIDNVGTFNSVTPAS